MYNIFLYFFILFIFFEKLGFFLFRRLLLFFQFSSMENRKVQRKIHHLKKSVSQKVNQRVEKINIFEKSKQSKVFEKQIFEKKVC